MLGGCAWFVNFRKDKQEAKGIRADNRQKEMDLSKMYVDEEGGLSVLFLAGCASSRKATSSLQLTAYGLQETRDSLREEPTNEARAEPSLLELCLARRRKTTVKSPKI